MGEAMSGRDDSIVGMRIKVYCSSHERKVLVAEYRRSGQGWFEMGSWSAVKKQLLDTPDQRPTFQPAVDARGRSLVVVDGNAGLGSRTRFPLACRKCRRPLPGLATRDDQLREDTINKAFDTLAQAGALEPTLALLAAMLQRQSR